ncbi:hypothetical protein N6H18_15685 [Reichenbachiella agarivorans]|uniref:Outer membrane protein beta-barrel domain-containing protein n=1 Tax=Reichenbachiella agarivorans TaxID=2979464 RepID=A0ABY6CN30_9BACT|nr:hypothetical protein [Reichenbachiella agarivorans]UXP31789.1 hypothetical protein N6H18_15685 [Reichenbachiella agarivorans]
MKTTTLLCLSLLCMHLCWGQNEEKESSEEKFKHHKIMVVMGHTHVPAGIDNNGKKEWLVLGSWGIDYDYRITSKWSIGLHSDLVLENFEYDDEEGATLQRSRPLASTITVSRKFGEHFSVMLGGGGEFAKEENLTLFRVGLDYGWELPGEWEIAASLMSDFKINAYNSWVLGIGVGRSF